MGYDAAGNLAWSASGLSPSTACSTSGGGTIAARRVDRAYDARNRLTSLAFPDGNGDQSWTYAPDGLPSQVTTYNVEPTGTTWTTNAYTYNKRRMLTGESQFENDRHVSWTWAIGYGYNPNGHLDSLSYPANLIVDFQPNALGQATQATSATASFATNVLYHPNGAVKQFTYGNTMVHRMEQNARQLPAVSCDAYGGSTICGQSGVIAFLYDEYDYDHNGNVFAITDLSYGRNQRGNRNMGYDDLDRLTSAMSDMWTGTATYAYDALDNIVQANLPATLASPARNWAYCYDTANRIDKIRSGTCTGSLVQELTHDLQGNISAKAGTSYGFDFGNRLRSAGTETYRYDAHGRRTKVTSASGNLYNLYGHGGQLFWTRDERDNERRQFVYLAGSLIAEHTRPIGASTEVVTYQHTDALGSPVVKTTQSRSRSYYEYEPYGALANRVNNDLPGYTGHVMDAGTGLTYMQQRYYDPKLGVFLSVDPVTALAGPVTQFHRYRYANNRPYTMTDPDGRCGTRYKDGSCKVIVEPGTGSAGTAAGARLESVLNKHDKAINALSNKTKYAVKNRQGDALGSLTGKEIKKIWNGTRFVVTDKTFNNGGVGGGTSGTWGLFGSFSAKSELTPGAVENYEGGAIARGDSAEVGTSTIIFHELGHLTHFGMSLTEKYPVTPSISWPREHGTSSAAEAMSGAVGAPFNCQIPGGCL